VQKKWSLKHNTIGVYYIVPSSMKKYISLFLFIISGSCGIILMAQAIYDMREPIDAKYTTIGVSRLVFYLF